MPGGLFKRVYGDLQLALYVLQVLLEARQAALYLVVAVLVGRYAGDVQHLPVYAVQFQHALLNTADDIGHVAQHHFHAQGVPARGQVDQIRVFILVLGGLHAPALGIPEGQRVKLGKRHRAVNKYPSVYVYAAHEVLLVEEGDAVIAFFRHFERPLYPLPREPPGISADRVVQQIPCGCGIHG